MAEKYFTEKDFEFMATIKNKFPNAEILELITIECDDDLNNMKVVERKPVGWEPKQ